MRIGLISPKSTIFGNNSQLGDFWKKSDYTETLRNEWSGLNVSLAIIAALTPPEHIVEIIDENIEEIDYTQAYDLVGITCLTSQAVRAYSIAKNFRDNNIKVVLGGIHPTLLPDEAKQNCDSVVIGEAEYIWENLLKDFENNNLQPIYKNNKTVDLNEVPTPRYELLKGKGYSKFWIQATRGCPHDCEFCSASKIYGIKYRYKSVDKVLNEIKLIKKIFPDSQLMFSDDNLFANKKYSKQLLNGIINLKLNLRYFAQTDISIARDRELLSLIKKSGCSYVLIGFESVSEKNLIDIDLNNWKLKQFKNYPEYIRTIQSYGIGVMGAFIIGLENDDENVFDNIINFIKENVLYAANISILTPFPGTRIYDKLKEENRILTFDWSKYTIYDANFKHNNLSVNELENGLLHIYKSLNSKEFYLLRMKHFLEIQKKLLTSDKFE